MIWARARRSAISDVRLVKTGRLPKGRQVPASWPLLFNEVLRLTSHGRSCPPRTTKPRGGKPGVSEVRAVSPATPPGVQDLTAGPAGDTGELVEQNAGCALRPAPTRPPSMTSPHTPAAARLGEPLTLDPLSSWSPQRCPENVAFYHGEASTERHSPA